MHNMHTTSALRDGSPNHAYLAPGSPFGRVYPPGRSLVVGRTTTYAR